MTLPSLDFATLRAQTLGIDTPLQTPFGERLMVYADFTASGRCLRFVEDYLADLARLYANSHTEDDATGRVTTHLLHEAEWALKDAVNAGPSGRIIACGTGSTGAIDKLQQILGITLPPATRRRVGGILREHFGAEDVAAFEETLRARQPVVFVGPYEHHSNEVTWREGLATVVETRLAADGGVDLGHLEELLRDERWTARPRIGSFSAASNVTGMRTPVHEVARLLHRHDALACFDFAASAPYVEIDMNPEGDAEGALDAVFLSPHKYLGGPGASGVLVFNERLYPHDLAPSVGGGGTVDYVGPTSHDFTADVEAREKAGTPGVLQILRAALAVQVKHAVGVERIEAREQELLQRAFERWGTTDGIELLGNPDPARRIGIISFNLRCSNGQYLHPKLVTTLLNDLFGIQSRAGCSCAGPYGHRLLGIDDATSEKYRAWVRKGYHGIKPGWCRVGFHYAMDDVEADFIVDAVTFLAREGERFLPLYDFDLDSGVWVHREADETMPSLSIADALDAPKETDVALSEDQRAVRYAQTLAEAEAWAAQLDAGAASFALDGELGELQFFTLPAEA